MNNLNLWFMALLRVCINVNIAGLVLTPDPRHFHDHFNQYFKFIKYLLVEILMPSLLDFGVP